MVRLLSELERDTFDTHVITIKHVNPDLTQELPNHITIHELNLTSGGALSPLAGAFRSIRTADVLVCSLVPSIVVGSVTGTLARVPDIYSWRHTTHQENRFRKLLYSIAYRLSDGILVDSDASKQHIIEWGIEEHRITKLPLSGVKMDMYPSVTHAQPDGPIRVGTVGRLVEKKGYDELIECARNLPEFEFHVVGEGPLAEKIQNAPKNVVYHGRVSQEELQRLWGTFDIYFQPSRYEGLCITAIEGMAARLPIVASDIDGLSESIVDGTTGYLVEQGDINGYCDKLRQLAADSSRRNRMGAAGQERARQHFSSKALAREFIDTVK